MSVVYTGFLSTLNYFVGFHVAFLDIQPDAILFQTVINFFSTRRKPSNVSAKIMMSSIYKRAISFGVQRFYPFHPCQNTSYDTVVTYDRGIGLPFMMKFPKCVINPKSFSISGKTNATSTMLQLKRQVNRKSSIVPDL